MRVGKKEIEFNWMIVVSLITALAALVLIVTCIVTDEWDDVFLPIALGLTIVSNLLNVYRSKKEQKNEGIK